MYTNAEVRVVRELIQGRSNIEIANNLNISEKTVKFHITSINKKAKTKSRTVFISSYFIAVLTTKDLNFSWAEPFSPHIERLFRSSAANNNDSDLPVGKSNF